MKKSLHTLIRKYKKVYCFITIVSLAPITPSPSTTNTHSTFASPAHTQLIQGSHRPSLLHKKFIGPYPVPFPDISSKLSPSKQNPETTHSESYPHASIFTIYQTSTFSSIVMDRTSSSDGKQWTSTKKKTFGFINTFNNTSSW